MKTETIRILFAVFFKILKTLGSLPAEAGGILLGPVGNDNIITHFVFDKYAHTTGSTYTLNTDYLNPILSEMTDAGFEIKAVIHSHPQGYRKLSPQDIAYFTSQIKKLNLEKLAVPLVFSANKGGQLDFLPLVIYADGTVVEANLEVIPAIEKPISESVLSMPIEKIVETEPEHSFSWHLLSNFPFKQGHKALLSGLFFVLFLLIISLLPALHTFIVTLLKS